MKFNRDRMTRRTYDRVYDHANRTHGGGYASSNIDVIERLERVTMTYLLWEKQHYVDGEDTANIIRTLVPECDPVDVMNLAIRARTEQKLRHVPLLLAYEMTKHRTHNAFVRRTLREIIQRPDEITEFVALYMRDGGRLSAPNRRPLAKQVKLGLADAFHKFDEYQFAKWNRNRAEWRLRDVMFLVHPKPTNQAETELFRRIANNELRTPDTWEVALSSGADKRETFMRLIESRKLGGQAWLMNLRNMRDSGITQEWLFDRLDHVSFDRILPFQFIAAAHVVPEWEPLIEAAMLTTLPRMERLRGTTLIVLDTSGSMASTLSRKSTLTRIDAGIGLVILLRELCENVVMYITAGDDLNQIHATRRLPDRRGFTIRDAIRALENEVGYGGIFLTQCMNHIASELRITQPSFDRVIVITDEQDCDHDPERAPDRAQLLGTHNYIFNIGAYDCGIAYQRWHHINGWSEHVIAYIDAHEKRRYMQ